MSLFFFCFASDRDESIEKCQGEEEKKLNSISLSLSLFFIKCDANKKRNELRQTFFFLFCFVADCQSKFLLSIDQLQIRSMSHFDDPSLSYSYQFSRRPTSSVRPRTGLPSKNATDMFKLGIENRTQMEFAPTKKSLIRHHIHIPTDTRAHSPPLLHQPTPTPDLGGSLIDQNSLISSIAPTPTPIKSAAFTIPLKTNSGDVSWKNFPKQTHERRKITQERKRQKQLAQQSAHKDADHWFRLRQSLAELKRLATTEEILVDPTTSLFNCDGYSFEALKQAMREQQEQKASNRFRSESSRLEGMTTSMNTIRSFNVRSRTSLTASRTSLSRPQTARPPTETYFRSTFEPLIAVAKPIHPLLLTGTHCPSKQKTKPIKPPASAPPRVQFPRSATTVDKRSQLVLSDLSNHDDPPISITPSPPLEDVNKEQDKIEEVEQEKPTPSIDSEDRKLSSNLSLRSTVKINPQIPRCRSATDTKHSLPFNKNFPRFILITDQEHRIESWYHQYPFIVSDDLLQSFQNKSNKSTVSAYFIDEHQNSTLINKSHLQGKPFHINSDWKKYDLIFISNNIYSDIIIHLQTIIKLSGKIIRIYQINHHEDLKSQVRLISKQFYQQISSHV